MSALNTCSSLVNRSFPNTHTHTGGSIILNCVVLFVFPVSEQFNGTVLIERSWSEAEKWLLVAVLGLEMVMGVVGNCLVLLVKVMVRLFLFIDVSESTEDQTEPSLKYMNVCVFFKEITHCCVISTNSVFTFLLLLLLLCYFQCRGQFCCRYWLPFISLTLSDFGTICNH